MYEMGKQQNKQVERRRKHAIASRNNREKKKDERRKNEEKVKGLDRQIAQLLLEKQRLQQFIASLKNENQDVYHS